MKHAAALAIAAGASGRLGAGERATQCSRALAGELRLGVDSIDLLQHHEMLRFDDPGRIFA